MLFRKKSKPATEPAPVIQAVDPTGDPDLRGLGRILWRKKTRIIAFTLLATAAAFVVVNAITPRYRSESRILLESRENVFMRAEADKTNERVALDPEAVTSQIQLVLSRDLAREVIRKEKLNELPEFDPAVGARLRCGPFSACSASPAIRARCRRKSASWKPITSASTSMRSRSRA